MQLAKIIIFSLWLAVGVDIQIRKRDQWRRKSSPLLVFATWAYTISERFQSSASDGEGHRGQDPRCLFGFMYMNSAIFFLATAWSFLEIAILTKDELNVWYLTEEWCGTCLVSFILCLFIYLFVYFSEEESFGKAPSLIRPAPDIDYANPRHDMTTMVILSR